MSKTDKDKPLWVKIKEQPVLHDHHTGECIVELQGPGNGWWKNYSTCNYDWNDLYRNLSNKERGMGRKHVKWAKRYRSKRNRRRVEPHRSMRGYGYGEENYRFD